MSAPTPEQQLRHLGLAALKVTEALVTVIDAAKDAADALREVVDELNAKALAEAEQQQ